MGSTSAFGNRSSAAGLSLDTASIVRQVASVKEARTLPPGCIVGDLHGGLTFTDAVAAALESRSSGGWQEVQTATETWTLIILNR
jgi:crotonobetainyl-CoA:carnitine CoA-transferase CaiB-like acyl-CoA transferase